MPQTSVTEYFLIIVSVQPKTVEFESETNATTGVEQLSFAVINEIFGVGKVELQPETVKSDNEFAVGFSVSIVRIKF